MASPTFGAAGTHLAGGFRTTSSVAVPTGTANNEVVVVAFYIESTAALTPPAGFTEKARVSLTTGGGAHDFVVLWKRCTTTDTGTYNFTHTSAWTEANAVRYSGCVTSGDPFDATNSATSASATSGITPAVTATSTVTDTIWVFVGTNFNGGAWTPPSGFTERVDAGTGSITIDDKTQATIGSSGSTTATCAGGATGSIAWIGALKSTTSAAGSTDAPATSAPVTTTGQAATSQVLPGPGAGAVSVAASTAAGQLRPAPTSAPVGAAGQAATSQIKPNAATSAVALTAPTPVPQVRANAGSAAVSVAGQAPTVTTQSTTSANATVAPVTLTTGAPTATVRAQAGVATVGTAAADAAARVGTQATQAAVAVAGQDGTASTPAPVAELLEVYALASADPHSITIHGVTGGRDVYLLVNCPATITTPSSWTDITSRVATMASYVYRLAAADHSGGDIGVTLDLSVARPVAAVAIEAPPLAAGSTYAALGAPGNAPGSTAWGTGVHTFTARDTTLALFYFHQNSGGNPTFAVSSYDQGFTALADSGWAGSASFADEGVRIIVGYAPDIGFTADGVNLTLDAAGPTGSAVGFLAFDAAPAGTFGAGSAPVALAAGAATTQLNTPATSGPVAVAALAAVGAVAPQPGAAAVALTGQPATTIVRANAGSAAVSVAGQGATVNTSSSTNANAGVAAVGVAAQAAVGQVRPAPTSAPVGTAALFTTGSEIVLQLVMDNPVVITVAASNATVTTSTGPTNAPATVAPITVTAPAPVAQVRALAGVAAVGVTSSSPAAQVRPTAGTAPVTVAALQPAVSTSNQVLAQAGVAAVGVAVATGTSATVRASAGSAPVASVGLGALGQVAARPGGAVLLVAALLALSQARAQATGAQVSVAGRSPVMAGSGAVWKVSRAGNLNTYRALLDGVHPTRATIT